MSPCCDMHNVHCEPPSELCCYGCTEAAHPEHPDGVRCVLSPYRILITGSRTWDDTAAIFAALNEIYYYRATAPVTIVHGACPNGADAIAGDWYANMLISDRSLNEERHPADWDRLGKRAGFVRNAEMVELGADVCLAFIRDSSRGASHTADLAEKAGIHVRRWTA